MSTKIDQKGSRGMVAVHRLPSPCLAAAALALWLIAAGTAVAQEPPAPPASSHGVGKPHPVVARHDMVAAAHPLAAAAGREMLRRGGGAIDAAIATQLVLNLVEPQSSGIGGGAFLLYWDAGKKQLASFDGRETA